MIPTSHRFEAERHLGCRLAWGMVFVSSSVSTAGLHKPLRDGHQELGGRFCPAR